jgi:hypothetical protein
MQVLEQDPCLGFVSRRKFQIIHGFAVMIEQVWAGASQLQSPELI